ncbi:hypothetical protein JCM11491_002128 [Sporobolomyces phaffii]
MSKSFASPLGPLHLCPPSQMASFVVPLPSSASSRIRSFFRPSSKPTPSKQSSKHDKAEEGSFEFEYVGSTTSSFTPLRPIPEERQPSPSSPPPPPYRQAIEEDLYCEDVKIVVESKEERKRRELIEADQQMSDALKSYGF